MKLQKLRYGMGGLFRRFRQKRICPGCAAAGGRRVDRKGFHELLRCDGCNLLYRWPYETSAEMELFYQRGYQQSGLTTDLPDEATLTSLLATGFSGSEKDHSRVIELIEVLSVQAGARILDFGANWGYGVWQFQEAGFPAIGYEVSKPRVAYSRHLGVDVFTDWQEIKRRGPFDVVFSSHVLEHVPDPVKSIQQKLSVLSKDGWLVAFFPNGSEAFQKAEPSAFHRLWGQVHPVMLNEDFIRKILPGPGLGMGSHCPEDLEGLKGWEHSALWRGTLNTSEMMLVWTPSPTITSGVEAA